LALPSWGQGFNTYAYLAYVPFPASRFSPGTPLFGVDSGIIQGCDPNRTGSGVWTNSLIQNFGWDCNFLTVQQTGTYLVAFSGVAYDSFGAATVIFLGFSGPGFIEGSAINASFQRSSIGMTASATGIETLTAGTTLSLQVSADSPYDTDAVVFKTL